MQSINLLTIGHSNHVIEHFLDLMQQHRVETLVDVRRFPSSRAFPQFNQDVLSSELNRAGMEYLWMEALGGRRPKTKGFDSPNHGLRNDSFRNYADYMLTEDFQTAMGQLANLAQSKRTAVMCAESVFWRCHRRLISDFVLAHGGTVEHIFPDGQIKPHSLTAGASIANGILTYPGPKMLFD